MSLPALDNLLCIGQLKAEPRNNAELACMLARARRSLMDAAVISVSASTRFICAYSAGHAAALAALRWHGYRSENRFTVFQCLTHTLGWAGARWRVLDAAHRRHKVDMLRFAHPTGSACSLDEVQRIPGEALRWHC